jgi:hypothetical protein
MIDEQQMAGRRYRQKFMITLFHHPFCPHSRFVRLALGEYGISRAGRGARLGTARGISGCSIRRAPRRC